MPLLANYAASDFFAHFVSENGYLFIVGFVFVC